MKDFKKRLEAAKHYVHEAEKYNCTVPDEDLSDEQLIVWTEKMGEQGDIAADAQRKDS